MSSPFYNFARVVLMSAALAIPSVAFAQMQQSDDVDPEVRVQQLEGQLR